MKKTETKNKPKEGTKAPKILVWDVESSHLMALTFGLWKQNIPSTNVLIDKHLYCVCYRWYGDKKTHSISILDDPKRFEKDHHDDYYVVKEMHKVLSEADAVVAHHGDKFDMPMIQERIICHGLKPLPKLISLDTKKIASKYFKFTSNKLDFIAKKLGHPGKMVNPTNLWLRCFDGDEQAIKRLVKYCKRDISALYFIFEKMMPYIKNNPLNGSLFREEDICCCNPICMSTNYQLRGFNYTRIGKFKRYQCLSCGSWYDSRTSNGRGKNLIDTEVK